MTTRRLFCQVMGAAGGLALARPTLAAARGGTPGRRLIFVHATNGTVPGRFWPSQGRGPAGSAILAPLRPHAADLLLVRGLHHPDSHAPHAQGAMKALTNLDPFDSTGAPPGQVSGPSLDERLARSIGAGSAVPALRVASGEPGWGSAAYVSFSEDGRPITPIYGAARAFQHLFAEGEGGRALRALARRVTGPGDDRRHMAEVIAAACAHQRTRVVSWSLFPSGGQDLHALAHRTGEAAADAALVQLQRGLCQAVAHLITTLKATPDPGGRGSLFDHTLVCWSNEMERGDHGRDRGLPIVLAAGGARPGTMGRVLEVPPREELHYGNLLVSLAHAAGDHRLTTIGDPRWCSGPLSGLASV